MFAAMTLKDWIELLLLLFITADRAWRWKFGREVTDDNLGTRLVAIEDTYDDKVDSAELNRVEKQLDKTERELKDTIAQQGTRFHNKVSEYNTLVGERITTNEMQIGELRRRLDAHIDKKS